ncbi:MAG: hypothetical protein COA79_03735 [Planctomycetota bacterium]|nr:MAG: hypothetical protein COA79_03735 [Planctomycetota bacterium]
MLNIGFKNHQKGYSYKTKNYWRDQVLLVQNGSLLLKTNKIISKIKTDQLILFPKHSQFELECLKHYNGLFFAGENISLKSSEATSFICNETIKQLFLLIESELQSPNPHLELMDSIINSILIKLNKPINKIHKLSTIEYQKNLAQQIKSILEVSVHSNTSTEVLLEHLNLSYKQLSRYFQKYFNCSIKKYQIKLRIEKVKELLIQEKISVTTVAYELGFSSSQHLSNQFKLITNCTPLEWLKDSNNLINKNTKK